MRRAQKYRALILSGGVALYVIGMWFAWFDDQQHFGSEPGSNHEKASLIVGLAGVFLILFGTIVQGSRPTNARRALGGAGMILAAVVMVSLWDRGINFLYLEPSIHGWSAGFLLLPLMLVLSGIAWLLMAMGAALHNHLKRRTGT